MRAVIQRVARARVCAVDSEQVLGEIGRGLVLLLGIGRGDGEEDLAYLAEKTVNLRIFPDREGQMNLSLLDTGLEALIVPQFTLYGDCRKGRRPGFSGAAPPDRAENLYRAFVGAVRDHGLQPATGCFGAHMQLELVNDGPVTLLLDSARDF